MSTPIRPGTDSGASYTPDASMPPKPEQSSMFEDFMDIFYAPSKVFARRANSSFWGPLLVVSLVTAIFAFVNRDVMSAIFDAEYARGAAAAQAKNPQITAEQLASMRGIQEKMASFFMYIGTPIFIFIVSLLAWLSAKLVGAKVTYGQAVLIMAFAWVPRVVQALVNTVQKLIFDTTSITGMNSFSFSPARFMDPDTTSKALVALAGRFDLFTIWLTILAGIGIAVIGKVPRSKGYIAAAILFALGTLFPLLGSLAG
jgi:hypothetical protein